MPKWLITGIVLCVGVSALPAAQTHAEVWLTTEEIRQAITNHVISGPMRRTGSHAIWNYQADGSFSVKIGNRTGEGTWETKEPDQLCFKIRRADRCLRLQIENGRLVFYNDEGESVARRMDKR